jgi:inosine/xanthosine triphosphate pyrophosphatase family protein
MIRGIEIVEHTAYAGAANAAVLPRMVQDSTLLQDALGQQPDPYVVSVEGCQGCR